jgi:hypothetical protein
LYSYTLVSFFANIGWCRSFGLARTFMATIEIPPLIRHKNVVSGNTKKVLYIGVMLAVNENGIVSILLVLINWMNLKNILQLFNNLPD